MVITLKTNSATHMEKRGERPLVDSPVSGLISMVNSLLWPLVVEVVVMEYGSTVPRGQSLRVLQLSRVRLCRGSWLSCAELGDAPPPNQSTVEKPRPLTLSFSTVHCVSYDTRSQRELVYHTRTYGTKYYLGGMYPGLECIYCMNGTLLSGVR